MLEVVVLLDLDRLLRVLERQAAANRPTYPSAEAGSSWITRSKSWRPAWMWVAEPEISPFWYQEWARLKYAFTFSGDPSIARSRLSMASSYLPRL